MTVAAIIQARMGSTRLPQKTLLPLMGKPMLWHVVHRVQQVAGIETIVIATTANAEDEQIVAFSEQHALKVFRGSEHDVLDRFYQAAKDVGATTIVRVTSDCPLVCPRIIEHVLATFLGGNYDYVTNTLLYTYPEGCDVEVFSMAALERAWRECRELALREHVTPFLRNEKKFRIKNVTSTTPVDPSTYKWSVDTQEDFNFVRAVYERLYDSHGIFYMEDVQHLLTQHPELQAINAATIVNEGFYKSLLQTADIPAKTISIDKSLALKKQAETLIPGCSQTFSKGPSQFVQGVSPVFIAKGEGSHVWDVDGNEYLDYAMALGPIILGHNYAVVSAAIHDILRQGMTFSLPHPLEIEVANVLCEIIPCAEQVRYGKNGSDATSGAVRVARAYTGRDKIACCGYHGWQDWYVGTTTRNKGVPRRVAELTIPFVYNDLASLEKIFAENKNEIAGVIMEPIGVTEPESGFLQAVRELTHRHGALLIYDEIVTGFRFALGGAQEYVGITPDMACVGKGMANGMPIAAVVGRKDVMQLFDEVFYSFTFGGEIVSLAAARATIHELRTKNCIRHIWEQGRKIRDGYNVLAHEYGLTRYTRCIGYPPRTVITFVDKKGDTDLLAKSLFQQECLKRGILFTGGHNICFSHTDADIEYTLRVYKTVLGIFKDAINNDAVAQRLEGEPVTPVFRKA